MTFDLQVMMNEAVNNRMIKFEVNGSPVSFSGDLDMPLLWYLRENLGLTGSKYGCGAGLCGACTVHLDGQAVRSCVLPVQSVTDKSVTTIEGISGAGGALHEVQTAWIDYDVAQCGFCQAGQIMAAIEFLRRVPDPSDLQIEDSISNLCRCGTYVRVKKAIRSAADKLAKNR